MKEDIINQTIEATNSAVNGMVIGVGGIVVLAIITLIFGIYYFIKTTENIDSESKSRVKKK